MTICKLPITLDPLMTLELTYQEQSIFDLLKANLKSDKYPLYDWYLGALYALNNEDNPDRIAQAAHSLRELIEKLPRVVQETDIKGSSHDFKGMRRDLHDRFSEAKERYSAEWKDKVIDAALNETLNKLDIYLERNQQPTRSEQMQHAISTIDPLADQLASTVRENKGNRLQGLWQKLEGYSHHNKETNVDNIRECLNSLNEIIFDLFAPITGQDHREIKSILERSYRDSNDDERVLKLINRRGANARFFFEHVDDVTWIPALKKQGYFDQLPKAIPTDDHGVIFPYWWPIHYLKRVSSTEPRLVVDTILNFPDTDNPRILHTISEIALIVEPIEQSLRLKNIVLKYVQSPYSSSLIPPELIANLMVRWMEE